MEELNVKKVVFERNLDQYMNFSLKPNFKVAGPVLGSKIKSFGAALGKVNAADFAAQMEKDGKAVICIDGEDLEIAKDYVDIRINAKEGFAVAMENNIFTILDTTLTEDLIDEGLARELVSKVQQMRKQHNFEMMDHILIALQGDDKVKQAVARHKDYIMKETLAEDIAEGNDLDVYDLNGHKTGISVKRL